ncbi:hypothetical protein YPPY76_0856, partial [Yersinia pestis PY-76]
MAYSGSRSPSK